MKQINIDVSFFKIPFYRDTRELIVWPSIFLSLFHGPPPPFALHFHWHCTVGCDPTFLGRAKCSSGVSESHCRRCHRPCGQYQIPAPPKMWPRGLSAGTAPLFLLWPELELTFCPFLSARHERAQCEARLVQSL